MSTRHMARQRHPGPPPEEPGGRLSAGRHPAGHGIGPRQRRQHLDQGPSELRPPFTEALAPVTPINGYERRARPADGPPGPDPLSDPRHGPPPNGGRPLTLAEHSAMMDSLPYPDRQSTSDFPAGRSRSDTSPRARGPTVNRPAPRRPRSRPRYRRPPRRRPPCRHPSRPVSPAPPVAEPTNLRPVNPPAAEPPPVRPVSGAPVLRPSARRPRDPPASHRRSHLLDNRYWRRRRPCWSAPCPNWPRRRCPSRPHPHFRPASRLRSRRATSGHGRTRATCRGRTHRCPDTDTAAPTCPGPTPGGTRGRATPTTRTCRPNRSPRRRPGVTPIRPNSRRGPRRPVRQAGGRPTGECAADPAGVRADSRRPHLAPAAVRRGRAYQEAVASPSRPYVRAGEQPYGEMPPRGISPGRGEAVPTASRRRGPSPHGGADTRRAVREPEPDHRRPLAEPGWRDRRWPETPPVGPTAALAGARAGLPAVGTVEEAAREHDVLPQRVPADPTCRSCPRRVRSRPPTVCRRRFPNWPASRRTCATRTRTARPNALTASTFPRCSPLCGIFRAYARRRSAPTRPARTRSAWSCPTTPTRARSAVTSPAC